MAEIGVIEVRKILENLFEYDRHHLDKLAKLSDEKLLRTDLQEEFDMDFQSLDLSAMDVELRDLYHIQLKNAEYFCFDTEPTVEQFIEMVKRYGHPC